MPESASVDGEARDRQLPLYWLEAHLGRTLWLESRRCGRFSRRDEEVVERMFSPPGSELSWSLSSAIFSLIWSRSVYQLCIADEMYRSRLRNKYGVLD